MASDPAWKYCEPVKIRPNASKCKFYRYIIGGGGVTRLKNHLTNMDKTKSGKMCEKVPHEVHEEMRELVYVHSQKKKQHESLGESMQAGLRKSLGDSNEEIDEGPGGSLGSTDPRRLHLGIKKLAKAVDRFLFH